jgi:hypothetical protein
LLNKIRRYGLGITFVTNPGIAPKGREWPSWGMIKKTVLLFMGEW